MDCSSGAVLAQAQWEATDKPAVLRALHLAALNLRTKLGEPPTSLQKYVALSEQVEMPSLEAEEELILAGKARYEKGETAALPHYLRAAQLDPGYAKTYQDLSLTYRNLKEDGLAEENSRKAYALRDKVSEQQRLTIEANYYDNVTGELEKVAQAYQLLQQNYPGEAAYRGNLGVIFATLGNHEKALEQAQAAMRMAPNYGTVYSNVAVSDQNLNRFDEAEVAYKQAEEHGLSGEQLLQNRYLLAFSKGDTAQMAQMAEAAMGKPGAEDLLLASEADTEAWYGRFENARDFTRRAMDSAQRNDAKETAAMYQALSAAREVEAGNREQARAEAKAALKLAPTRNMRIGAALILARAGDASAAEQLAAGLDRELPLATVIQKYWLPTIRAAVALDRKDPNKAVELLQVAIPMDLSTAAQLPMYLCPAYVRGDAYLRLHDGKAAAAEFQKYVDHGGLLANFPWGALARLGLARAYALEAASDRGAHDKARKAYQDFLTLWKDADPDVPILKQAKSEYARLQ